MNKLESKGQNWFLFVCALAGGPALWRLIQYIYHIFETGAFSREVFYPVNLLKRFVVLFLIGGIFFLMYRGNLWSKWIYFSLAILNFAGLVIHIIGLLSKDYLGLLDPEAMILQIVFGLLFSYVPALLLAFSSPINAFLRYKHRLSIGDKMSIDNKLNQIGKNE